MPKDHNQIVEEKLDNINELLQNILALELSKRGVPHGVIGKRLHVSKTKVGEMLEGVKKQQKTTDQ